MDRERPNSTRTEILGGAIVVALAVGALAALYLLLPREAPPPEGRSADKQFGDDFSRCDVERQSAPQSAIALQQPDWMTRPPDQWCVLDAASGAVVARTSQGWGPQPVPAGTYRVRVRQYASDGLDLTLPQIIEVGEGELVRVVLCGGIRPEPAEWVATPYQWGIVNKRGEYLQFASGRWDAILIPPGIYRLAIQPRRDSALVVYAQDVGVSSRGLTKVKINSGIKPAPGDWTPVPKRWAVTNREGKEVQRVAGAWEAVVLPPAIYGLVVHPAAQGSLPVRYPATIAVNEGEVTSVPVNSGVAIEAAPWVPVPYSWSVVDRANKADVQVCKGRWDKLLIPPGRYNICIQPAADSLKMAYMPGLAIPLGKLVVLAVDTGLEISPAEWVEPPRSWTLYRAETREAVQQIKERWGRTVAPPGRYLIGVQPGGHSEKEVMFGPVAVLPGRLSKVALGSGVRLIGPKDVVPLRWTVLDIQSGKTVQTVRGPWGSTIVPPGVYRITFHLPFKDGEKEIVAAEKVVVADGRSDVMVVLPKSDE
ncbi:MAG: hypothetical protein AB1696_08030 [Planctomycetota bacterium]